MKYTLLLVTILLATACAKRADSVAPANIPVNSVSCDQRADIMRRVAELSARQNQTATNDTIGVLLIGVPTSSLNGKDVETDLAIAKGQLLAIEQRCG
jgi:orotate phosphoribosyltransferase-like protein